MWHLLLTIVLLAGPTVVISYEDKAAEVCTLPQDSGSACKAQLPRFHFDQNTGLCSRFVYSGCGGNANNFETLADCLQTCGRKSVSVHKPELAQSEPTAPTAATPQTTQELCALPPIEAKNQVSCLGFIPSWTFNATAGQCQFYVYGGCGRTANLFSSEQQCKDTCAAPAVDSAVNTRPASCLLPNEHGPCFGWMKRYSFNREKNRCEPFRYGGCRGNANNFRTADQCFQACGGDLPYEGDKCEAVKCGMHLYQQYIQFGCRPEYQPGGCCPSAFNCPQDDAPIEVPPQCFYRGAAFQIGETIPQITEDEPCKSLCFCDRVNPNSNDTTIVCAESSCAYPEFPQGKTGCRHILKPGECCPNAVECDEEDHTPFKCSFEGKDYLEGDSIETGVPCKKCICTANFTGLNGPGCRDIHCLMDVRFNCVPIFTDGKCCPVDWRCSGMDDGVPVAEQVIPIVPVEEQPMPIVPVEDDLVPVTEEANIDSQPPVVAAASGGAVNSGPALIPGGKEAWQVHDARCLEPMRPGRCKGIINKFYFDADQNTCLEFTFTGCGGNENQFESKEECMTVCKGPTAPTAIHTRTVGEKKAVVNRVITVPAANAAGPSGVATLPQLIPGGRVNWQVKQALCLLPAATGPCRMTQELFHYDADEQKCKTFFYGGCKGNDNRFETEEACLNACRVAPKTASTVATSESATESPSASSKSGLGAAAGGAVKSGPALIPGGKEAWQVRDARCLEPKQPGNCKGMVHKFYFDADENKCLAFVFTGCGGNDNQFESEEECTDVCKGPQGRMASRVTATPVKEEVEVCQLPQRIGPCRANIPSYSYDAATGRCQSFLYSGCLGNANRFSSEEECLARCSSDLAAAASVSGRSRILSTRQGLAPAGLNDKPAHCLLHAKSGPCRGSRPRYFYDRHTDQCKRFTFGGCRGNANNFVSIEQCQEECQNPKAGSEVVVRGNFGAEKRVACKLPADRGFCRDQKKRYFYDSQTKTCKTFVWGGCQGNANNFATEEQCLSACGPRPFDKTNFAVAGCTFGNVTLQVGEQLVQLDPCVTCSCLTPPKITCTRQVCPPHPENGICKETFEPGRCCPVAVECVSADPPFIDPCADVLCAVGEVCRVKGVTTPLGFTDYQGVCSDPNEETEY